MAINDMILTATGNLTGDPELRFTPQGVAVAQFSIAINPKEYDRESGQYKDAEPSFVRVQCWRSLAENVAESLTRGTRVIVTGRWREERWEDKDGTKHSAWRLTADAVGAELTFAHVKIQKSVRQNGTAPDDPWATASKSRPETSDSAPAGTNDSDEPPF